MVYSVPNKFWRQRVTFLRGYAAPNRQGVSETVRFSFLYFNTFFLKVCIFRSRSGSRLYRVNDSSFRTLRFTKCLDSLTVACAASILETIPTADEKVAFTDIDVAILVGAFPRKQGMERKDLLKANAKIFESQGKSLNEYAKKTVKVCTVSFILSVE